MVEGWLKGGLAPERLAIVDPALAEAPGGVALQRSVPQGARDSILLGFKPHMLKDIAPSLTPAIGSETVILSVLAGVELATLRDRFGEARAVVRVMPNLAAALGKSPIALAAEGLDETGRDAVTELMQPLGQPEWIGEEQFDLVTALAGSGPAFVYRFIEALSAGAVLILLAGRRLWHRFRGQPDRADLDRPDPIEVALSYRDDEAVSDKHRARRTDPVTRGGHD